MASIKATLWFCGALLALGFLAGYSGKRLSGQSAAQPAPYHIPSSSIGSFRSANDTASRRQVLQSLDFSGLRSSDSLDSLKTLSSSELYGRLALWMLDADIDEIEDWWAFYQDAPTRDARIDLLTFANWTRLDPADAIARTRGASGEILAWRAWTAWNPEGALAAALEDNSAPIETVALALAEFRPEWVIKNLDRIPENHRRSALAGMAKWDRFADPQAALSFFEENGMKLQPGFLRALIQHDPFAVYDRINDRSLSLAGQDQEQIRKIFLETLAAEDPRTLEQIAAQTPPGAWRRQIDAALFEKLLESDPEAAKKQALATTAPKIAEQRLISVSLYLLGSDPEEAFRIARELLVVSPAAMDGFTVAAFGNGDWMGFGGSSDSIRQLMRGLMVEDPARTMALASAPLAMEFNGLPTSGSQLHHLGRIWADSDLDGFSHWVNEQTDPAIRASAAGIVSHGFLQRQQFADAAAWAESSETQRAHSLAEILDQWSAVDPGSASQWLDRSDLPPAELETIHRLLEGRR